MLSGSTVPIQIKVFVLLVIAPAFFGCALTPNVDNRKPGRPWSYYGDLVSVYRDQTGGTKVELVWMDQVQFTRSPYQLTLPGVMAAECGFGLLFIQMATATTPDRTAVMEKEHPVTRVT